MMVVEVSANVRRSHTTHIPGYEKAALKILYGTSESTFATMHLTWNVVSISKIRAL